MRETGHTRHSLPLDPRAPAVAATFVGCKVSRADNEEALAALRACGLEALPAARCHDADLVVVHTCCVTAEAEHKSRRLVRRWSRAGKRVVAAGCAACLHPQHYLDAGAETVGERGWAELAADCLRLAPRSPGNVAAPTPAAEPSAHGRARAVLKVQDGCAGRCSYCAVRLVRGRPRSRPLADVQLAVDRALAAGCGELVLSGIDLGAWHEDGRRFPDLVAAVAARAALRPAGRRTRVRISSLEPRHVDAPLLEVLAHADVARHLHVPLQSADDGVLAAMGRHYTFAQYLAAADLARRRLGELTLTTDVMVGFPAESEEAFARTLDAVAGGLFGRVHVFAFSPRPGTPAACLPPLAAAVVKERRARALAAADAAAGAARRAALGRPADVLLEEQRAGVATGYSSEYMRYYVRRPCAPGDWVRVVGEREHGDGLAVR